MSFSERLASIGSRDEHLPPSGKLKEHQEGQSGGEGSTSAGHLVQRCIIIQRDERGYGFTVSGDNPVFVASVKTDGAAAKAGVQQGDRIVKVNGTLVTSRNHLDVVKLIKSGSYVALTLLGKPPPNQTIPGSVPSASNIASNRDSVGGRVTAPQPVDPDKDRELWQQKVHMTRAMHETAKEDFVKLQRQYVTKPSDKLHTQLLEKEKTVKALENQLKQLTSTSDDSTSASNLVPISNRLSDCEHGGVDQSAVQSWHHFRQNFPTGFKLGHQSSVPAIYQAGDSESVDMRSASVARSKSDAATRKSKTSSTFYVPCHAITHVEAKKRYFHLKRASSLPTTTSDLGSMSDSPQTSPSVSPTPNDPHNKHNGQDMEDSMMGSSSQDIITIDDEDIHSEDDQVNDPGPFADIKLLENKPAHMAILLNYLISNSDPSPVFFHIISEQYSRSTASTKELRKWAYEIYSTFIAQPAPLSIGVEDNIISHIDNILTVSLTRTDNETTLRNMFQSSRQSVQNEITELLSDFCNKKDLGMGNFYGFQKLQDNMDRAGEIRAAEELLMPYLVYGLDDSNRATSDRDQATAWAVATFLRSLGGSKSTHSSTLDRVQTFMMKDKRSIKFPGTRSSRAKAVKGHQFNLNHFYVTTYCNFCGQLIWGVGSQGYLCHICEMTIHKQCADELVEACGGKQKGRKDKIKIPVIPSRRLSSNAQAVGSQSSSALDQLHHTGGVKGGESKSPPHTETAMPTVQPYPKEEDSELAGIPTGHSVQSIVKRYHGLISPTGGPAGLGVPEQQSSQSSAVSNTDSRRGSTDLNRSGSLNNKGEKSDRPNRRAKSDVDMDPDTFKAINQSGSSSASSLSNRSVESPGNSTDNVNELARAIQEDPDLDVEPELPPLKEVLSEDILRKLKPKEKKRQEVINELFYTERAHLRNLKIIDLLFNRPMLRENGIMPDLARALFPNMEEMILLHVSFVKDIKERCSLTQAVKDVGDLLLKRFDGEAGEKFRKGCAEYCRNQAFALDALRKQTRKEPKLQTFLNDAESNSLCRRLQLKDLVPSQTQRLAKYPLLIDNLLKYTPASSEEYKRLERAHERCKHILAYVNQAVKECENYHKLKDIQKKLDRRSVDVNTTDPALKELRDLDLAQHKLIFDGPLTWKLRAHRTVDLHVLLFDDQLVLLQKQDDKYVLKCQSTNVQSGKDESKYTHSPILRLQNVLARNLATDKKSFFVVNINEVRAQMYEFTAATSELRVKWCKLINEKADDLKKNSNNPSTRAKSLIQTPQMEQVELERNKLSRISRKERKSQDVPATDQVDSLSNLDVGEDLSSEGELIQPEEVNVSDAITAEATPVRSALAMMSQGESSASEVDSSGGSSSGLSIQQQQQIQPPAQLQQQASLNVSVPMSELKGMASDMKEMLTKLVAAVNSGSQERHRLRKEVQEAQQKLEALKEKQRQMTESGSVPSGRSSPRFPLSPPMEGGADIPQLSPTSTTAAALEGLKPQEMWAAGEANSAAAAAQTEPEVTQELTSNMSTVSVTSLSSQQEEMVHHGIHEATVTQLEESVETLSLSSESAQIMPVIATESCASDTQQAGDVQGTAGQMIEVAMAEDDDDDDDNNEVSVADLPLPESIPEVEEEEGASSSRLIDNVELEESDGESDDNDTLTSRTSYLECTSLATTLEDTVGEEREEGQGQEPSVRKNSANVVDTEIITTGGAGDGAATDGAASKDSDGSSVDAEKQVDKGGGGDSGEGETTPIQI